MEEQNKPRRGRPPKVKPEEADTKAVSKQPFIVMRDFWPEEGDRVRKGEVVEMFADEALQGIASGALKLPE